MRLYCGGCEYGWGGERYGRQEMFVQMVCGVSLASECEEWYVRIISGERLYAVSCTRGARICRGHAEDGGYVVEVWGNVCRMRAATRWVSLQMFLYECALRNANG